MPLNKVIGALVGAWVVALIGGVASSTGVELTPEDVSGAGAWVAGAVTAGVGAFIAAYFTPENVRKLIGYLRASKGRGRRPRRRRRLRPHELMRGRRLAITAVVLAAAAAVGALRLWATPDEDRCSCIT